MITEPHEKSNDQGSIQESGLAKETYYIRKEYIKINVWNVCVPKNIGGCGFEFSVDLLGHLLDYFDLLSGWRPWPFELIHKVEVDRPNALVFLIAVHMFQSSKHQKSVHKWGSKDVMI